MLAGLAFALAGCEAARETAALLGDLYKVRQAVTRATGHTAVQARISNGTTLAVKLINPPFVALPEEGRRSKARHVAQVAYAAFTGRASLGSVSVGFVVTTRRFVVFAFDVTETFTFTAAELSAHS